MDIIDQIEIGDITNFYGVDLTIIFPYEYGTEEHNYILKRLVKNVLYNALKRNDLYCEVDANQHGVYTTIHHLIGPIALLINTIYKNAYNVDLEYKIFSDCMTVLNIAYGDYIRSGVSFDDVQSSMDSLFIYTQSIEAE